MPRSSSRSTPPESYNRWRIVVPRLVIAVVVTATLMIILHIDLSTLVSEIALTIIITLLLWCVAAFQQPK